MATLGYRRLGRSGLKVSELSYGSWVTFANQLDTDAAAECVRTAYEAGVNFFDGAEVYADGRAEEILGSILRRYGWGRDTYCVSSKVFWGGESPTQLGLSRKHVRDACHAALRRLGVDYLDLYFCHRPDEGTPIEETVRAMSDLVHQGLVLYWGTSEWSAQQIQEAYGVARERSLEPPTMEQPQYNMFHRVRVESEYRRLYDSLGLGTTTWSPLASGILTGKYAQGVTAGSRMGLAAYDWLRQRLESPAGQSMVAKTNGLASIARELGLTTAQLAIAWCLKNPNVSSVILGATSVQQLEENLAAAAHVADLTDEVLARIEEVLDNRPDPPPSY